MVECIDCNVQKGQIMGKILSVIVPSYNMEKYLPKCLGSLVVSAELMERLEVLVVNDGSKDRTSEIAHEFEAMHPQTFSVVDKLNGNYGSCINAALPKVHGRYVKVLDADDSFNKQGFERFLSSLLDLSCDADLIITDYCDVAVDGGVIAEHSDFFDSETIIDLAKFAAATMYIPMHTYTYRTAILRSMEYRQCEGVSYSDTEWVLIPLLNVSTIRYIPTQVYRRLMGREGQTMDPSVFARNSWMLVKLADHMVQEILCRKDRFGTEVSWGIVEKRLLSFLRNVYRVGLIGDQRSPCERNLREFDMRLRLSALSYYQHIGGCRYSKRLPIRYVCIWRINKFFFRILLIAIRMFSSLMRKV